MNECHAAPQKNVSQKKIAIIGECMIELSGQPFQLQTQSFGGDTLNTAVYLSRLQEGLAPYYVTGLGCDSYSQLMKQSWQQEGINTSLVVNVEDKLPGLYSIQIDDQGERSFHYWRSDSAARYLCEQPQFEQLVEQLKPMDLIYLSGISLAILADDSKAILLGALARLKQHGVKVAVDSNYRPRLWRNRFEARNWLEQLYRLSDIALVTGEDEELLLGLEDTPAELIAERLHLLGVEQVVVKLGAKGAMWSHAGQRGYVVGNRVSQVVDTTAAGDSFNGAYLAAWCSGMSMAECCHWGNKLAAQVIQFKGAIIAKQSTRLISTLMSEQNEQ
ncbi:TPA: sugar kinase [Vibrio vulnificus]|uniref:sugar kinase n=1 Tax=Vibrio vulnificus TaxID=672 RepID=UPI001A1DE0AC|nr:sugar kinase [Vibrio vulnificus]EGQ8175655.1 sugar kinase [Vibrio vulnificus]ELM6649593.1 sugar kinase [Vibrio vulnificus]MCG6288541.1 sugar kinase [Vibrio vulnificus]HAS6180604.1 sugar kinase [Vibrio vulnificus]HAS6212904.1 sugar kinase [Vibrio vulnificus]